MKEKSSRGGRGEPEKIIQYCTVKARLYPNEAQARLFENTFGCCRYIWNRMLADQQRFYLETDAHFIPTPAKYKKEAPFLTEVDNQALIQEHNKLSQAFRMLYQRICLILFKRRNDADVALVKDKKKTNEHYQNISPQEQIGRAHV